MIGQFAAAAAVLASVASAQSFVYPGAGTSVTYNVNQQLQVSWNSPYQYTFVDLYQGPPWVFAQVANATSSQTSYTWTAAALADLSYNGATFFFRLGNALDPNAQTADSGDITLMPASNGVTTGSSVAGPSATASSTSDAHSGASSASSTAVSSTAAAATGSSSTSAAAAPAATSNASTPASAPASGSGHDTSAASGEPHYNWLPSYLGVGLGVGLPVLFAAIAGIWYSIHSKRKLARESVALEKGRGAP